MSIELAERVCDFLLRQGGAYATLPTEAVHNVFYGVGSGQYVINEKDGEIEYFACYWRVNPEDVEGIKRRVKPATLTRGSVMYVTEAACAGGMWRMVRALREQAVGMRGVIWHRPVKGDKLCDFPSQRGEEV